MTKTAARYLAFCHRRGDGAELFARIRTPTLVVHRRADRAVGFEEGRRLAALVPGARFLPLSGDAHYFPTDQPGTLELIEEITRFLADPETQAAQLGGELLRRPYRALAREAAGGGPCSDSAERRHVIRFGGQPGRATADISRPAACVASPR